MKTLHFSIRISDLNRSLAFYSALGYIEVGQVGGDDIGLLVFLKFPDDLAVALELVHRPSHGAVDVGNGFSHLAIQTDDLAETLQTLTEAGLELGPLQYPAGPDGPKTAWFTDPDGYPIELVQWPPGHADGLTAADFT